MSYSQAIFGGSQSSDWSEQTVFGWKFLLYDDRSSVGRWTLMGRPMFSGQPLDSRWPVMGQQPVLGHNISFTNMKWHVRFQIYFRHELYQYLGSFSTIQNPIKLLKQKDALMKCSDELHTSDIILLLL